MSDVALAKSAGWPGDWKPTGLFAQGVVGESNHRPALAALVKNEPGVEAFAFCYAVLRPYSNPHDPHAVAVEIEGHQVGHLPRGTATAYREVLSANDLDARTMGCAAVISGGLVTAERVYDYRVELDFAYDAGLTLRPELPAPGISPAEPEQWESTEIGTWNVRAWLPEGTLADYHPRLDAMQWTANDWETVSYYIPNSRRAGLGHRLLRIPKHLHAERFGTREPTISVELDGRWANVRLQRS